MQRIGLRKGIKIQGDTHDYVVGDVLCTSGRSTTYLCRRDDGEIRRLKLYDGEVITTEIGLQRISLVKEPYSLLPEEIGNYSGCCYTVTRQIDAESLDRRFLYPDEIVTVILPKMYSILHTYHSAGILLRDITPEHMIMGNDGSFYYTGFGNFFILEGGAASSHAKGFQHRRHLCAPEITDEGYSFYSDYYDLGISLLWMLIGREPYKESSNEETERQRRQENYPEVDFCKLQRTDYRLLSVKQRIQYLTVGLLIPEKKKRWGLGEIRCWLSGQRLPWKTDGERIYYRFSNPVLAYGRENWNEKMLADAMARDVSVWGVEEYVFGLTEFAKAQELECADTLGRIGGDSELSCAGKIFCAIYALYPHLSPLWIKGWCYRELSSLVLFAGKGKEVKEHLQLILREGLLRRLCDIGADIAESLRPHRDLLLEMESLYRSQPEVALNRFILYFAGSKEARTFCVFEVEYHHLDELIRDYEKRGEELYTKSAAILRDPGLQAWLWIMGTQDLLDIALKRIEQEESSAHLLLLMIAEKLSGSKESRARIIQQYLRYGEYAPLAWLVKNTGAYRVRENNPGIILRKFQQCELREDDGISVLHEKLYELLGDYIRFIEQTYSKPKGSEDSSSDGEGYRDYYPKNREYAFSELFRDLRTCPAMLRSLEK